MAHFNLGEPDAAAAAMRQLRDVEPTFTVEGFAQTVRYRSALLRQLAAALVQVEAAL